MDEEMTDEELAEEYAEDFVKDKYGGSRYCAKIQEEKLFLKIGFQDGLKAGRPQWHDLRKDPNDLPESYHMSIINQDGEKVMYDYSCKAWRYDDADEYLCDTPIAWCEIPTFNKE